MSLPTRQSLVRQLASARRRLSLISGSADGPRTAIVAVTLNCNARCTMCDIWKNRMKDELRPEEFAALPASLRDINISGGEPFLRKDLPDIVAVMRERCPSARLVISTNGFTPARIEESLSKIIEIDPGIAVRFSLDGMQATHDRIRGIPGGFDKTLRTLDAARRLGVRDLGIGFTLLDDNTSELAELYRWTVAENLELSVTVATDSPIFFGEDKATPKGEAGDVAAALFELSRKEARTRSPKRWMRAWFERKLATYVLTGKRPIECDAAAGFFYLDSMGTVYGCHVRNLEMGNIREQSWDEIWTGVKADEARVAASGCSDCLMVCTSKSQISKQLPKVIAEAGQDALRARFD